MCIIFSVMFIGLTSVKVKDLNWHSIEYEIAEGDDDFNSFGWSSEDIQCLRNVQVYLAADGMYFLLIFTISKNLFLCFTIDSKTI